MSTFNLASSKFYFLTCIFAAVALLSTSCSRKTVPKPSELSEIKSITSPVSYINLPVMVSRTALNLTMMEMINEIFREGLQLDGGFLCRISVDSLPDIQASQREVNYHVPLQIDIRPNSRRNPITANGRLSIRLRTRLELKSAGFESSTELVEFYWNKTPVVRVLGLNIPAELIANQLLRKYEKRICTEIDAQIMESLDLQQIKSSLSGYFSEPFFSSDDGLLKVYSTPKELAIGPLLTDNEYITLPSVLYLENVISQDKPYKRLPDLVFSSRLFYDRRTNFALQARIPVTYIEGILSEQLVDTEFGSGATKVKVEQLKVDGVRDVLRVRFNTTGGFKGGFQMEFTPEYQTDKQRVVLKAFDLKLVSGKSINKSLFALIKQRVARAVKESIEHELNVFLNGYLEETSTFLDNRTLQDGISIHGMIDEVNLDNFWIQQEIMYFSIKLKMQVYAKVDQIDLSRLK